MEAIPRHITGRSQGESFEHLERGRGAQAADSAIEETREGQVFDEWRKCENGPSEAEDTTYGRCAGECVLNRIAEIVCVGVDTVSSSSLSYPRVCIPVEKTSLILSVSKASKSPVPPSCSSPLRSTAVHITPERMNSKE